MKDGRCCNVIFSIDADRLCGAKPFGQITIGYCLENCDKVAAGGFCFGEASSEGFG